MDKMEGIFAFGVFGYAPITATEIMHLGIKYTPAVVTPEETASADRWKKQTEDNIATLGSTLSRDQFVNNGEITMQTLTTKLQTKSEYLHVAPGKDSEDVIYDFVIGEAHKLLLDKAAANRAKYNEKFPTGIDLKFESNPQKWMRMVYSRIFALSSMLAMTNRVGPANFVLISAENYAKLLLSEPRGLFYHPQDAFPIKMIISPIGNTVIVGRCNYDVKTKSHGDGIYIQCAEAVVSDFTLDKDGEVDGVNCTYSITEIGEMPCVSFNIV